MLKFYAFQLWEWLVAHGIPLSALIIIAILIPRVGRLAIRIVSGRFDRGEEATKSRLALVGALVYVVQAIAYFAIIMLGLTNLGVPAMGAALPATVVSAAIGFGAQNVIGDFLAGFFIISERQFGVGDFVAFDGTSSNISGTVVALTLRATKIRTASGEVVMIPNGSAGVITNYSQDWSRAVVDLAVPLQPGESMAQLTDRVEATAAEALRDPTIAEDVTGELEVLPATDIVAPTAAGQSWQVNFRVMVVVNPARQWAVERVLRSALVNVFWDRYDMPRVFRAGTDADAHTSASRNAIKAMAAESALAPTEVMPAQHPRPTPGHAQHGGHTAVANAEPAATANAEPAAAASDAAPAPVTGSGPAAAASDAAAAASGKTAADGTNANSQSDSTASSAEAYSPTHPASKDDGPGTAPLDSDGTIGRRSAGAPASANATAADAGATDSVDSASAATDAANATATATGNGTDTGTGTGTDTEKNADDSEQNDSRGFWRDEEHSSRFKRIMSVGGRTRPSTTGLIIALMMVGGLALASSNPDGRDAGWLSPDYWRDRPANSATTNKKESDENQPTGTNSQTEQQSSDKQQPTDGELSPSNGEQSPTGSEQSPAQGSDSSLNDQGGQSNQNPSGGDSNSPGNNPSDGSASGGAGGNGSSGGNGGAGTNGGAGNGGANSNGAAGGAAGGNSGAGGNAGAAGGGAQNNVSNEPKDSEFDAFDSPASITHLHALGAPNATNATRD